MGELVLRTGRGWLRRFEFDSSPHASKRGSGLGEAANRYEPPTTQDIEQRPAPGTPGYERRPEEHRRKHLAGARARRHGRQWRSRAYTCDGARHVAARAMEGRPAGDGGAVLFVRRPGNPSGGKLLVTRGPWAVCARRSKASRGHAAARRDGRGTALGQSRYTTARRRATPISTTRSAVRAAAPGGHTRLRRRRFQGGLKRAEHRTVRVLLSADAETPARQDRRAGLTGRRTSKQEGPASVPSPLRSASARCTDDSSKRWTPRPNGRPSHSARRRLVAQARASWRRGPAGARR